MGAYLSQPKTTKESTDHDGVSVRCGASSMQGWRISQEDAHNCILEFDKNASLFAVYDGHGGHEVAEYCAKKLPDFLKEIEDYKNGNYEEALKSAFLSFDATLATPEVLAQLKVIAKGKKDDENTDQEEGGSDSEGEEAIDNLVEEAHMPLDELMAKYKGATPQLRLLKGEGGKPPMSPMLRARRGDEAGGSGASTNKRHSADAEVSSSSSNVPALCNGEAHVNGEVEEDEEKTEAEASVVESSDKKKAPVEAASAKSESVKKCDEKIKRTEPDSSGLINGESHSVSSSSGDAAESCDGITSSSPPKKKVSSAEIYQNLLQADSDSEEEDETFTADAEASDSSDDAAEGIEGKDDDDEDGEEEEEEDEEEESDDEEGDHDDGRAFGHEEPGLDSGCTAVVALLAGSELFVANAGDSRCVVCRDGQAVDMSVDHKPEDKPERDRIQAAGGCVTLDGRVNGGLNLSRAIGDHSYKQSKDIPASEQMITALPDIQRLTIDPAKDEFMVLACDGIWNSMTSQEVVDFVRAKLDQKTEKLSQICEELFDFCLAPNTLGDGTGCDNMTCVIVHFKSQTAAAVTSNKRTSEPVDESEAQPSKKSKMEQET